MQDFRNANQELGEKMVCILHEFFEQILLVEA